MKALSATLIPDLLLPQRHVAAIVVGVGIKGWQGSTKESVWGLMVLTGLEIGPGPLIGHVLVSVWIVSSIEMVCSKHMDEEAYLMISGTPRMLPKGPSGAPYRT